MTDRLRARPEVIDERLSRPDWTNGKKRDGSLLWLDKNENTDPILAEFMRGLLPHVLADALYTYPECAPLYHKLAAHLAVSPSQLLLTPGSDGAIRSVFEAFVERGDVVIHTSPTFAMYPVYCQMYGARPVPVAYEPGASGPVLSAEKIIEAIGAARPKLVCLPNPDSPTGTMLAPDRLRAVIEAAGQAGAVMLLDEAYHPFYRPSAIGWTSDYPHLAIARTFAKAWGLAGLRIGYAVAAPPLCRLLHKVRNMYEVNTVAVAMLERVLDHADQMEASVARLLDGKRGFLSAMRALGLRTLDGEGNFLHVAFGERAPRVHARLANLVLYRRDFAEPCLSGFSRFSATTADQFAPVIAAIREVLA
jgi:histidinol-phosphate aminotransferase